MSSRLSASDPAPAVSSLRGVGPKLAQKLAALGIHSVADLLFHLPLRYLDRSRIVPIGALQAGRDVVVEGEIKAADVVYGRRRSLVCRLQDGTGTVTLRFFHFSQAQRQNLEPGTRLRCAGEARRGATGLEFYHPEYRRLDGDSEAPTAQHLTPIYPSTEGVGQATWRKLTGQALAWLRQQAPPDLLPPALSGGVQLSAALSYLHRPPVDAPQAQLRDGQHAFQQRLALEELLAHHLSLLQLRQRVRSQGAPVLDGPGRLQQALLDQLGFALTAAQQRVASEIDADLHRPEPMLRLLQGDVGSGKTVVAALAALRAAASGYQVAIMAPTEILAEQHRANFSRWLQPLGLQLGWLSGKLGAAARRRELAGIASGDSQIVVGTHALFQPEVEYQRLGLVIIDEQHRFGVHQRLALKAKGTGQPHQLIMTATPIPRTLAMSAYADLDTSVIDELPPGRQPVQTRVVDNRRRDEVVARIRAACAEGRQAYWVCTLIEESEQLQAQAAEATCEALAAALPELRVALVHGRLGAKDKAAVMAAFAAGDVDLLVATTVIEVGVDVPNASLMVIENAERLGLAQLHQLRGRVGRGSAASHCLLLYQAPLSRRGRERLAVLRDSNDGFVIAERDLQLRGPGEVLGTRQTGLLQLRVADLERDRALLAKARQGAEQILAEHPERVPALLARWVGDSQQYAAV